MTSWKSEGSYPTRTTEGPNATRLRRKQLPIPQPEGGKSRPGFVARFIARLPPFTIPFPPPPQGRSFGDGVGDGSPIPVWGSEQAEAIDELTDKILYRLSLDPRARDLAAAVLDRFQKLVGDLPASADHHHRGSGGLYQHSLEVALGMLKEFEGTIIMERRTDGSVDSFRSARNRPRWQYLCFLAALCHDLGKVFDMEVRLGDRPWFPLSQGYRDFWPDSEGESREGCALSWRQERKHGSHAALSNLLLHHLLTPEDFEFLGLERVVYLAESLAGSHDRIPVSPIARLVSKLDQASVEAAQISLAKESDSKIGHFIRALTELIKTGKLGVNRLGGQVYVMAGKTAIVVPLSVNMARKYLHGEKIVLPPNTHLYDLLRNAQLVEADRQGHSVRSIRVTDKARSIALSALVFSTDRLIPRQILPTLPPIAFEIEPDSQPEAKPAEEYLNEKESSGHARFGKARL